MTKSEPSSSVAFHPVFDPELRRALEAMAQRGVWCRPVGGSWMVVERRKNVSLKIVAVSATIVTTLREKKWIAADKETGAFKITALGKAVLANRTQPVDFQSRGAALEMATLSDGHRVLVNRDESALSRLARMKKPDGAPLLDAAQINAGERLAAEIMRAGMVPGITMRWDATGSIGEARVNPTDLMIASRQRVEAALDALGHDFAGLLLDVLAFSKGIEQIERERHWPQRSGKIIVGLALARLALHYGYAVEARGAEMVRQRVWRAPDARPSMS